MNLTAIALLVGLCVGSFLNVVIWRLPLMLERQWRRQAEETLNPDAPAPAASEPFNLARPRSACPACLKPIRPWHNLPVIGWLLLRGRCAECGARIPVRYPIVEAFTGAVTVLVVSHFGPTLECAGAVLLCWALIALAVIDFDHQILPDIITLPLMWTGLLFSALDNVRGGYVFTTLADLQSSVFGAMAGYLSLWTVYQLYRLVTGKEGMGYGDLKLLAGLGAWLGWQMLPVVILLSACAGAVIGILMIVFLNRDRQIPIPFGPYLAAAGFVALMWGQPLIDSYRRVSGI
ncbi:MAG: prepilin peptidase [Gammaproteobacteria bacterium]|nr:prepilin peptidase [Gammaproteobacteria bacterium]